MAHVQRLGAGVAVLAGYGLYSWLRDREQPRANVVRVNGWADYQKTMMGAPETPVYQYFISGRNTSGNLWCPDCLAAEPAVDEAVAQKLRSGTFMEITVGDKELWQDQSNSFRTELGVNGIPHLRKFMNGKV